MDGKNNTPKKLDIFPDDYYKYDSSNYKKFLERFAEDIRKAYSQDVRNIVSNINKKPNMRVILCGMGGSSIAGQLMQSYIDPVELTMESVHNYSIPGKLTKDDLVIITSYSGNTEEAISCYRQVRREGCQLILMSAGGKLEENSSSGRIPFIKLPKDYQPRAALSIMFFTLLRILEETALIAPRNEEVQRLLERMQQQSLTEFGINLSEKLHGKVPLIYTSTNFYPVAYRWKTQINENAKAVAFCDSFPELDHNEIIGFENKNAIFHVVMLTTDEDNSRMRKRMTLSKELIQEKGIEVTELHLKGERLHKIFNAVLAGDLTSYYLALRYRLNPEPVVTVESLKKKMGPFI